MRPADIHGYADRLSAEPGDALEFKVSCERPGTYRAELVRLICGDTNPAGPGYREEVVSCPEAGDREGHRQATDAGSFVEVPDPGRHLLLTRGPSILHAFVVATAPGYGSQALLGRFALAESRGYALMLEQGRPAFRVGDGDDLDEVVSGAPLEAGVWYSLAVALDPASGTVRILQEPVVSATNGLLDRAGDVPGAARTAGRLRLAPGDSLTPFTMAGLPAGGGSPAVELHFNGKLERPAMLACACDEQRFARLTEDLSLDGLELMAGWDFAAEIGPDGVASDRITDRGPHRLHGRCVHAPTRAVTGRLWSGRELDYRRAPDEYAAIHFHDTDLEDCGWETDVELSVPDDLPSGCYALRLTLGESEDHVPFFVRPPDGTATADALVLMPTATYIAYANAHAHEDSPAAQLVFGHTMQLSEQDMHVYEHPEYGLSLYGLHRDGTGNCWSTALRPIVNMRPRHRHLDQWGLPADLHLIDWLTAEGFGFDVATDHDLHREGSALLERYRVVLAPTHPEYCSAAMLDAWSEYLARGGRALYLGANGFYWVTGFHPDKPHLIEVRRGEGGSRPWQSPPGELHLASTGEPGGLWRSRGRPPQKLFGVGMSALGWDRSSAFRLLPHAAHPRAGFIMEGIDPDEPVGDFGLVGGGAAGHELDRYDRQLGTPPETLLLAASERHSDNYQLTQEEIRFPVAASGGSESYLVRGDVVYFSNARGGGVFSAGSIAWCGSLAHNGYDNNVSRMTGNVLRRFLDPEPLP
jgi:N,N-dimethylformamidase